MTSEERKQVKEWIEYYRLYDNECAVVMAVTKVFPDDWESKVKEYCNG